MSKNANSADDHLLKKPNTDLLQALNAAAGSLQRSARSREAVFETFEEQTAALGWHGSIMLLDDSGQSLTLAVLAYPSFQRRMLHQLSKQFGIAVEGYTFPVKRSTHYQQIIDNKSPRFVESNTEIIAQIMPDYGRSILQRLINVVGGHAAIFAPIMFGDKVQGMLNIAGPQLREEDLPAVEAFANHIAIALENADLISALKASESRQRLLFDQASDGIFVFNENNQLIDVNRKGRLMLDYKREELLGKSYEDLITPENLEETPVQLEKLLSNKAIVIERYMQRRDGSEVAVEVGANLLPDGSVQAVVRDITARIQSEKALQRREKILEAIAFAAGQFLRRSSWKDGINEVLSLLGKAAEVSRVYIFQNYEGQDGLTYTSQKFEWNAPGIPSQLGNVDLQDLPFQPVGFGRWEKVLSSGNNIFGIVEYFPKSEQILLNPQGILSILVVPIFSRQKWWGFIGFDECTTVREWEPSEMDALQAAAGTIGAAIEREWVSRQERQRRQEAEMLIDVSTALTSTLNLDQLLNNILIHLQQVIPFVSACIFLLMDDMVQAVAGFQLPNKNAVIGNSYYVKGDHFLEQMQRTRQPVILEDAQKDENFKTWGETTYIRAWMGVPLVVREKVIGYVTLDSDRVGVYQENETRLAQAFVNQAAIAIENAQLFAETQRLLRQTREQTQQLQQVMNIVPDGILLLDNQKRIISVNQAGKSYLEKVGEISEDGRLVHIGSFALEELYQPVPTSPPWKELTSKNGLALFEAAIWPLHAQDSDYWVLVIQDVTEERAQQSYRSAQERLAIVGQMAAGIAHDFNNIMAVILLYTQMLLQMPNLPAKEEKRLLTILQQSQRASKLIHQILDFSRQSLLERKPLSLEPFLKELTQLLQRTLPENIEVIFEADQGHLLINGDPTRIQQVIMNLALNARDAMPEGGWVKVSVKDFYLPNNQESPLPDMPSGQWLMVQVWDNGAGISTENIPHIFEPFFTTKPIGQGTGLGLAQVYGIIKQHNGFINVKSTLNEGTTFTIYLPAYHPEPNQHQENAPELPRTGKYETILVVEDNENARSAVVEILEMLNYKTLSAPNGAAALEIFKDQFPKIDLVLSDMVMPVMDGTTLHRALQEIKPDIKMVMMTGYPLDQSGKALIKQNIVAWMQKPLHTEQIAQTVHQALHESND